jgi:hypothetical protein
MLGRTVGKHCAGPRCFCTGQQSLPGCLASLPARRWLPAVPTSTPSLPWIRSAPSSAKHSNRHTHNSAPLFVQLPDRLFGFSGCPIISELQPAWFVQTCPGPAAAPAPLTCPFLSDTEEAGHPAGPESSEPSSSVLSQYHHRDTTLRQNLQYRPLPLLPRRGSSGVHPDLGLMAAPLLPERCTQCCIQVLRIF